MNESTYDAQIIDSWMKNTQPWTNAVRCGEIPSRQLVTNQAIIQAVTSRNPSSVLDLGCGEGWLTRSLVNMGISTIGVDAIPDLIHQAKTYAPETATKEDYRVLSYEDIAAGLLNLQVDVVVCNFALFGQTSVENIFATIPNLLNSHGSLIIQTLHPVVTCGNFPYQDGWRNSSWDGFSNEFTDPAPWYFRTLTSWVNLFVKNSLQLIEIREPLHPHTLQPASVIFIAQLAN